MTTTARPPAARSRTRRALTWATALGTAPVVGSQTIDLDGELFSLAGTATIDVFGFFTGSSSSPSTRDRQRDGRSGRRREHADRRAADDVVAGAGRVGCDDRAGERSASGDP